MTRGTEIVAAIAQDPFWSGENQFATVKPIAVIANDRLEPVRGGDYPNRDLCWWLIRGISPIKEVVAGRLIVGHVEEAERYDPQDPDKDRFQLDCDSVKLGGPKNIIEIIDAPPGIDARELINGTEIATLDHAPTSLVLARCDKKVYGPFKAEYEQRGRRFHISLDKPQLNDLTLVFDDALIRTDPGFVSIRGVSLSAENRPLNRLPELFNASYQLLLWNRFEALQTQALDRVRLYRDKEIVRQAAKQVLTNKQLKAFLQEWDRIQQVYLSQGVNTLPLESSQILSALTARLKVQCESVDELVKGVLESSALDERVGSAITQHAKEYVEANSAKLNAEIAEQVEVLRQNEESLRQVVQQLDNDVERRRRLEEAALEAELQQRRKEVEEWVAAERATIQRERADIDTKREILEKGLNDAAARFIDHRDILVADFLSLSPFLGQLGALTGSAHPPQASTTQVSSRRPRANPPAFLAGLESSEGLLDEGVFFERFHKHVKDAGFRFKQQDLLAFHLSVKCGDLTVLGGLSGTGKSSLPVLYAQALAGDENRFLAVDVSPAWLEPGDLLGRANLLEEKFQPAPTGLFEYMIWAATESNRVGKDSHIWIVCLDEMNLAQPEHYFSGFLQALPRSGAQRAVNVFSAATVHPDDPWRDWHRIPLESNVRFIGTVNYDETTKPLSQRLLDRANQLQFEAVPFGSLQREASTAVPAPAGPPVTVASFEAWIRESPLTGKAAAVIDEIQKPLARLGSPLTPRRYQAITRFVASAKNLCSADEAFDMQLRQRVLLQLRGLFRPEARRALDEIRHILDAQGSTFAGALQMVERLEADQAREIDFESFELG